MEFEYIQNKKWVSYTNWLTQQKKIEELENRHREISKHGFVSVYCRAKDLEITTYKDLVEKVKISIEVVVDTLDKTDYASWTIQLKESLQAIEQFDKDNENKL